MAAKYEFTRPVINVSWDDISQQYLPWLIKLTGHTYRVLTEAEWEYVAGARSTTKYWLGNEVNDKLSLHAA